MFNALLWMRNAVSTKICYDCVYYYYYHHHNWFIVNIIAFLTQLFIPIIRFSN